LHLDTCAACAQPPLPPPLPSTHLPTLSLPLPPSWPTAGKDLTWYAKGKGGAAGGPSQESREEQRRQELERVKEEEEAAMAEMLGLARPREEGTP